mmetsp:Transcript_12620/g.24240  ORF Transcript_12620/g.24240 Transcript_12620/m.24240 type:complete len:654 (+) Transcript_12620:123-2084(+)
MSDSSDIVKTPGVEKERERWTSRWAFYFAAIGAAVGFGNVWRFPALAADYGGGAFFIPYLMALFLIGIPLLILEIGLGQYYQTGDVGVFGSFHRRWKGVGVSSVSCAYMVVTYYSVLIAWVINAFFDSFGDRDPWAREGTTGKIATDYFIDKIIGAETLGDDGRPTRMVWANVGYSALAWFLIWACLAGGTEYTGRITYFTMGVPIILLFVFLIKSLTLEGASDGIKEYIGRWDTSVLTDRPDCWSTAVSQIFFSIGVTFGIMTAFGSYCDTREPATVNSVVIAGSNSMFSFLSGFAVFASLGHLASLEGVGVKELDFEGFSLVFGTWPVVFGTLPGGEHWVRLLFFDLFLLGIDSGFGLLEGSLTAAADTVYFSKWTKAQLAGLQCSVGFLFSVIYCTDAGLNFLDVVDYYINFVMLLVGFFETFAAGWIYGLEEQINKFGRSIILSYFFTNFASVFIASVLWFSIPEPSAALAAGFATLGGIYVAGMATTAFLMSQKMANEPGTWTSSSAMWWDLGFGNVMHLRERLADDIGYLPTIWAYMMKQFIPHVILILFINLALSETDEGKSVFGNYGGYRAWPFQYIGYGAVLFAGFLFILGLVFPDAYNGLTLTDDKAHIAEDKLKAMEGKGSSEDDNGSESKTPADMAEEADA